MTPDWTGRACAGMTDLFFARDEHGGNSLAAARKIAAAKALCQDCPVRDACLQFALDTQQPAGIWGGLTEDERLDRLGRKTFQTEISHGTEAGYRRHLYRREPACRSCLDAKSVAMSVRRERKRSSASDLRTQSETLDDMASTGVG